MERLEMNFDMKCDMKCKFQKNKWFVFYGDEDGDKYNRGFQTEVEARNFCVEVALSGGTVYDIYYE